MDIDVTMIAYTAFSGAVGGFIGDIASANIRWITKSNGSVSGNRPLSENTPDQSGSANKYDLGTIGSLFIGAFAGAVTWGLSTTQSLELHLALAAVAGITGQYFILRLLDRRLQQDTNTILADIVYKLLAERNAVDTRIDGIEFESNDLEGDDRYG